MAKSAQPTKTQSKTFTKTFVSLTSPFSDTTWPTLTPDNEQHILELLCSLLAPIGDHRVHHVKPSKGKRNKKRKKTASDANNQQDVTSVAPSIPDISQHILVGFNSTVRSLQAGLADSLPNATGEPTLEGADRREPSLELAAIFVDKGSMSELLWEKLPMLVYFFNSYNRHLSPTRLIPLPKGSELRLHEAMGIHRAGIIGIAHNAPGSAHLLEFVQQRFDPIVIPWLENAHKGEYHPTMTDVKTMEVSKPNKKKVDSKAGSKT